MTAIAHDADQQRELDAGRVAPGARTASVCGTSPERTTSDAERESWAELQSELRRLERRRQSLNRTAA